VTPGTGPGQGGPGESGSGESGPGESGPGESGPGQGGPGESGPGESGPGESGPGESGPGESGPGPKVFCLGFNKTGTTSLHHFFRAHGLSSRHDDRWAHATHLADGWRRLEAVQCFSDGECAQFRALARWYPDAVVVLNDRDERAWLRSRVRHVLRAGDPADPASGPPGEMAQDFLAGPEAAIGLWIARRRLYHARLRAAFAGAPRFVELRVAEDPGWADRLAAALRAAGVALRPDGAVAAPHANARGAVEAAAADACAAYDALIDACLARAGADAAPVPHPQASQLYIRPEER